MAQLVELHRAAGWTGLGIKGLEEKRRLDLEDPQDRDRYATAFETEAAGKAAVKLVRVVAPEEERKARIVQRDLDPVWHEWGHLRTVELHAVLEDLALDDAVVTNAGRSPRETAEELLETLGW